VELNHFQADRVQIRNNLFVCSTIFFDILNSCSLVNLIGISTMITTYALKIFLRPFLTGTPFSRGLVIVGVGFQSAVNCNSGSGIL
jgi:hypothetical protein